MKDYDDTPNEDIVDLLQTRAWIQKREDRESKKGSRAQSMEDAVRRKAGLL